MRRGLPPDAHCRHGSCGSAFARLRARRCADVIAKQRYDGEPGALVERYRLGYALAGLEHEPLRSKRARFVLERSQQRTPDSATAEPPCLLYRILVVLVFTTN